MASARSVDNNNRKCPLEFEIGTVEVNYGNYIDRDNLKSLCENNSSILKPVVEEVDFGEVSSCLKVQACVEAKANDFEKGVGNFDSELARLRNKIRADILEESKQGDGNPISNFDQTVVGCSLINNVESIVHTGIKKK